MKIVLFSTLYTSPFSVVCSLVTASSLSHAGIIQDGKFFDTTVMKNEFSLTKLKPSDRLVTVYDFPDIDATEFITESMGVKYDLIGLGTYPLRRFSKSIGNAYGKMYCFETASRLLFQHGIVGSEDHSHVSGRDLTNIFNNRLNMVGERMSQRQLLERHLTV